MVVVQFLANTPAQFLDSLFYVTVFCPAFPEYTVTIFHGRMFLGSPPLGDSFKQNDPVTPMTNSNLVEVLQSQTSKHVGLISHSMLIKEVESVRSHINKMLSLIHI